MKTIKKQNIFIGLLILVSLGALKLKESSILEALVEEILIENYIIKSKYNMALHHFIK
jgi:hypothetical protein